MPVIQNSFAAVGICPFNPDKVKVSKLAPEEGETEIEFELSAVDTSYEMILSNSQEEHRDESMAALDVMQNSMLDQIERIKAESILQKSFYDESMKAWAEKSMLNANKRATKESESYKARMRDRATRDAERAAQAAVVAADKAQKAAAKVAREAMADAKKEKQKEKAAAAAAKKAAIGLDDILAASGSKRKRPPLKDLSNLTQEELLSYQAQITDALASKSQ